MACRLVEHWVVLWEHHVVVLRADLWAVVMVDLSDDQTAVSMVASLVVLMVD